jgi:pimeloyl-ACP methyl ester carboxylesterase
LAEARKPHLIYVPGLGEKFLYIQSLLVGVYPWLGIGAEFFPMNWDDGEPYAAKQERLLGLVRLLRDKGLAVSLLGFSGGGTAAMNAYVAAPELISAVVFISGKLAGDVNEQYYRQNPAFREAMEALPASLVALGEADKAKMLTMVSRHDPVVPPEDGTIAGVESKQTFGPGHGGTLVAANILHGRFIANFIKRRTN